VANGGGFRHDAEVYDFLTSLARQAERKARGAGVDAFSVANSAFGAYYAEKMEWAATRTPADGQPVSFTNWFDGLTPKRIDDIYERQFAQFRQNADAHLDDRSEAIRKSAVDGAIGEIRASVTRIDAAAGRIETGIADLKPKVRKWWQELAGQLGTAIVVNVFATVVAIVLLGLFAWWIGIDDRLVERVQSSIAAPAGATTAPPAEGRELRPPPANEAAGIR
jgi:hypothetical protein